MTLVGTIIDKTYVQEQNPNITTVTQADLASAALQAQSANQANARGTLNSYKQEYGEGVCTLVMIYNATGAPLGFRSNADSSGHIGKYPFDSTIENGQWSVFLHVHTSGTAGGSIGALGYDIQDGGMQPVAVIGWNNPLNGSSTALGDCWSSVGYTDTPWDTVFNLTENGGASGPGNATGTKYGYAAPYSIGQTSSPILQVVVQQGS